MEEDEDTALAPSDDATEAVRAWSLTEGADLATPTERYSWRATWMNAGVLAGCATLIVATIALIGWRVLISHSNEPPAHVPAAAAPQAASPAPGPAPSVAPSAPTSQPAPVPPATPDAGFKAAMEADGITAINNDWPQLIFNAHRICWGFAHNIPRAEIMKETRTASKLPDEGVNDYVGLATAFYCPQYADK